MANLGKENIFHDKNPGSPTIKVRRLPRSHYSNSYRSQYFHKAKLVDKITSIQASKNILFLVNFYRQEQNGIFTLEDFADLERLAPIIGRFVLRHTRLSHDAKNLKEVYEKRISHLVQDSTQIFSKLSLQERRVCENILMGSNDGSRLEEPSDRTGVGSRSVASSTINGTKPGSSTTAGRTSFPSRASRRHPERWFGRIS